MINLMENGREHILLIESDPQISQLIAEQALKPFGYQVEAFDTAASAIQQAETIAPDLIITNLNLPGLSGKDLLVALGSVGITAPIIVIANKGQEADVLHALRLGASDFLVSPIRELEVINIVEKIIRRQRQRIDPEEYSQLLEQTKNNSERQLSVFSEILSLGMVLRSGRNRQTLYEKIASVAMQLTDADCVWIIALDAKQNKYLLKACQNVSESMQARLHLPWEDGLSTLVAVSGEVVTVHGETLERFNHSEPIESMMVVPVKQGDLLSTIITVARKTPQPFSDSQRSMLEFVAQFSSVLLENIQHFRMLEQNQLFLQHSNLYSMIESDLKYNLLLQASTEIRSPLKNLVDSVDLIFNKSDRRLNREQAIALKDIQEEAEILMDIADSMVRVRQDSSPQVLEAIDLNEVVCNAAIHFQPIAQMAQIMITQELPTKPTMIKVYLSQITKVIEGLLSNALKYSPLNGQVTIRVEQRDSNAFVKVADQGELLDERTAEGVFDKKSSILGHAPRRYGGLGISLPMIKEIISAYKGSIWTESKPESGFSITFSIPRI